MRLAILVLVLLLVFVTLNYILKCLEYKDLRELFDNRGKSIKMLNEELERCKSLNDRKCKIILSLHNDRERLLSFLNNNGAEVERLRHKVYVLRKDIKRKDRAIVRYKTQNDVFRHSYHEVEKRNEELRDKYLTECNVSNWYKNWYSRMSNERDAYLYCLRQIQEEVENAKKE